MNVITIPLRLLSIKEKMVRLEKKMAKLEEEKKDLEDKLAMCPDTLGSDIQHCTLINDSDRSICYDELFERIWNAGSSDSGESVSDWCDGFSSQRWDDEDLFIDLSCNCIERDIGKIVDVLTKPMVRVVELTLDWCDLDETQIRCLAPLVKSPYLKRLNINHNYGANVLTVEYLRSHAISSDLIIEWEKEDNE